MKFYTGDMLPDRIFWPDAETQVDLSKDEDWTSVLESMQEYVRRVNVPVLKEHTPDGGEYGKVISVFEEDNKMKVTIAIESKDTLEDIEKGNKKYKFISPRIRWNHRDVLGMVWPAALLEVSLVSVPRNQYQDEITETQAGENTQKDILNTKENAQEISLSEKLGLPVYEANLTEITEIGDNMSIEDMKAMIAEMIAEAFAKQAHSEDEKEDAIEDEAKEESDEVKLGCGGDEDLMAEEPVTETPAPEAPATDDMMSELEDMKAAYATLKAEYETLKKSMEEEKEEAVMSAVKADLTKRGLDTNKIPSFVSLYKTDKKAYETAMSAIPVKGSVSFKSTSSTREESVTAKALKLQKEKGITYKAALKEATKA